MVVVTFDDQIDAAGLNCLQPLEKWIDPAQTVTLDSGPDQAFTEKILIPLT